MNHGWISKSRVWWGTVPLEATFWTTVSALPAMYDAVLSDQRYPSGNLTEALYNMAAHASNPSTQEEPGGLPKIWDHLALHREFRPASTSNWDSVCNEINNTMIGGCLCRRCHVWDLVKRRRAEALQELWAPILCHALRKNICNYPTMFWNQGLAMWSRLAPNSDSE